MLGYSSRLYSAHSSVGAILPKSENELRFTLCCTNGSAAAFYFSDWRRFLWDSTSTDRPSYCLFSMASSWPCSCLSGSFLTILAPATISTMVTTVPAMRGRRARCRKQELNQESIQEFNQGLPHMQVSLGKSLGSMSLCRRRGVEGSACFQMCSKSANRG